MTLRLDGKTAIITGGSKGLGAAYAKRLAQDGANIAIADRSEAEETVAAVQALGREALATTLDVTDEAAVGEFARTVEARFGRADILVNNAGIYPFQPFEEMAFADWRKVLSIDLDAVFLMCRALVPGMKARGFGRIINISSAACWQVAPNSAHYQAAKMGVVGLTRALASEYGGDRITANAIAPGLMRTGTTEREVPQFFDMQAGMQAIKRVGETSDVVGAVAFLASDDAAFITGQTIVVDGGLVRL